MDIRSLAQGSRLSIDSGTLVTYNLLHSVLVIRSYAARCGIGVCSSVQRVLLHKWVPSSSIINLNKYGIRIGVICAVSPRSFSSFDGYPSHEFPSSAFLAV